MFICESCHTEDHSCCGDWSMRSCGPCEICGNTRSCYDCQAHRTAPTSPPEHIFHFRCPKCGSEEFKTETIWDKRSLPLSVGRCRSCWLFCWDRADDSQFMQAVEPRYYYPPKLCNEPGYAWVCSNAC